MIKPDLEPMPAELGAVHFVGIGGSGMSGIARLFLAAGHRVTGSDLRDTDAVRELRELGATVAIGHDAANVGDADTLVVTGALWQDNPEYQFALGGASRCCTARRRSPGSSAGSVSSRSPARTARPRRPA